MDLTRFLLLEELEQELADACNALLARYQELHLQIKGKTFGIFGVGSPQGIRKLRFDHLDTLSDCPDRPYRDDFETEENGFPPPPTDLEWLLKHADIHYKVYLGYESEFATDTLPFRWLFDPNWEEEACTQLGGEAARQRAIAEHEQRQRQDQELAELKRLQEKYKV